MIDDIDRIMAVMVTAFDPIFGEAWTRAQIEASLLLPSGRYLLIGADGHAPQSGQPTAGFALLRRVIDEEELMLIAIAPEFRRQGLGARLLQNAINSARRSGICNIFLEMRRGNQAETLYTEHGFVPIAMRPNYYLTPNGQRLDAISFRLNL